WHCPEDTTLAGTNSSRFVASYASCTQACRSFIMNVISNLLIASALVGVPSVLGQSSVNKENEIPTIAFCEMVRHPERYFDRTIRISATMELGDEGSNLNDVRCVQSHDDSIGVSAVPREQQGKSFQKDFEKIR